MSSDPIGKRGGFNLYDFGSNNAINKYDSLGLTHLHQILTRLIIHLTTPITPKSLARNEFVFLLLLPNLAQCSIHIASNAINACTVVRGRVLLEGGI